MPDRPYRVTFSAKPIIVHARDEKQALEIALEYLRQPESDRIRVENVSHD
jgi:1,2-phenylacetyl-CoA epoxidase PaaB subunit